MVSPAYNPSTLGRHFHKIKGKETLSRSYNLNITQDNVGLTESFAASTDLCVMHTWKLKFFGFEIFLAVLARQVLLPLEPLCYHSFCIGHFQDRVLQTIFPGDFESWSF
jgi:hypothetical protein